MQNQAKGRIAKSEGASVSHRPLPLMLFELFECCLKLISVSQIWGVYMICVLTFEAFGLCLVHIFTEPSRNERKNNITMANLVFHLGVQK